MGKFTYKEYHAQGTDSLFITNSDGCSWCDGVGTAPDGSFCGECTNICKDFCGARKDNNNDDTHR